MTETHTIMSLIVLAFSVLIKLHYNERARCTLIRMWLALQGNFISLF